MSDIHYSTISSVLSRLRQEHEEIVVAAVNRIYKEMPEYAHVERTDLVNTVGEIIDLVLDRIGVGTVPDWASSLPLESRSEEHTSELQSRFDLVCRLLLEKKN